MNRTIKFRGKRIGNGTLVYGNLLFDFGVTYVGGWEVEPESVAQLVGFDRDGNEVYEGDYIITHRGDVARVSYHDNPAYIKLCKLEEVTS